MMLQREVAITWPQLYRKHKVKCFFFISDYVGRNINYLLTNQLRGFQHISYASNPPTNRDTLVFFTLKKIYIIKESGNKNTFLSYPQNYQTVYTPTINNKYRSFLLLLLSGRPFCIFKSFISSTQRIAYKPCNWSMLLKTIKSNQNRREIAKLRGKEKKETWRAP